jgi:uroporphyrinogen decarboxylase
VTHRERIEALLAGEKPDRLPVSFWRHFYESESSSEQLKTAMLKFEEEFDWDLMKINPRASYHMEDWGNKYEYTGHALDKPKRLDFAVHSADDWEKISPLNPHKADILADHLKAISLIREKAGDDLPIVMTVFNPISIAGDLVKDDQFLVEQIRTNPDPLHKALKNITKTFTDFSKEAVKAGADGIFFATTQWASHDLISENEYKEFGRKYDMMLLEEVIPATKLNILHVCAGSNMLPLFADYPFKIVNWDMNDSTNPDAEKGAGILKGKIVMGGVDRKGLLQTGSRADLESMVERYKAFAEKQPFILAPDCSIPVTTPDENLRIIKAKIEY